jgi:hypothetical protein
MAKVMLKGKIMQVGSIEQVGEKKIDKQIVLFKEPDKTDDFGKFKYEGDTWAIDILGDDVKTFNLKGDIEGRNATLSVYINSRMAKKEGEPKVGFFISAKLGGIQLEP